MGSLTEGLVVMADPDFAADWLYGQELKCEMANFRAWDEMQSFQPRVVSKDEIARESRHDELVELMNGYAV